VRGMGKKPDIRVNENDGIRVRGFFPIQRIPAQEGR